MPELVREKEYIALLQQVRDALAECAALDETACMADANAKQATISGLDFVNPMKVAVECVPLCRHVVSRADQLEGFPTLALATLHGAPTGILNAVKAIREYQQNPGLMQQPTRYEQQITPISKQAKEWLSPLLNALSYVNREAGNLSALRSEIEAEAGEVEKARRAADDLLTQARTALETAKATALQAGVTQQGIEFREAEQKYRGEAKRWALGAGVCASLIILFASCSIFCSAGPPLKLESWTVAANLSHFAARVLVVTVFSFLMVVCVRTYRGAKHNEVMNAHRARALATFERFRQGSEANVAEAVTLHAAEAVFSVQVSGFTEGENVGSTHVAELLAALKGKE